MATATWIKELLQQRGVAFEESHHREAFTCQEVAQSEHISGHSLAKVVAVVADGRLFELVLPASRRVVLEDVRRMVGADQVRLASEPEMDRVFTDVETGAIPALRHWDDVDVIMDESLRTDGQVVLQAGTHEDTISLDFRDWYRLVQPRVGAFSEPRMQAANRQA
ncbi:MAG: YbaK/EbsC family protein [Isosphaeraceae bacterium]